MQNNISIWSAKIIWQTIAQKWEEIKECFPKVKQVFLLYLWGSLVTLIAY